MEPDRCWQLKGASDLTARMFEDGCVVYHGISGDTHYLMDLAGHVFFRLKERGPVSVRQLMEILVGEYAEPPEADQLQEQIEDVLTELARRGMAELL